ncbi:ABC transporter ATP-binding protein [Paenibacillus dakarensis]|uniref:ABC transporter ATP-binding protein n=1 Tax=Paenibacillus dakarensis TaxID=1527293 RepID=UPI0006D5882A|nr:ABC transporter ATP-binding protein [Paenibacillus dakarensis]
MNNWAWIWTYARQVKGLLAFTILLLVLEIIANIGVVGIQKFIIDDLFVNREFDLLVPLMAGLAGLAVTYNVLHLYAAMVRNKATFRLQKLLLTDMLHYMHRIPVRLFREERTGKYVTHLTDDVNQSGKLVGGTIPNGIMEISGAIILSVIIGMASPVLLLAVILTSIVYILMGKHFAPRMKKAAKDSAVSQTDVTVIIEEGIAASREVIAFHREEWESQRFRSKLTVHFTNLMKQVNISNRQSMFSMIMQWGIRLLVLGYGGVLVIQGSMSIGWLVIVFQFSTQLLQAYEKVYTFFMGMAASMASVERVREVMSGETINNGTLHIKEPLRSLAFQNVSFQYTSDRQPVIQGLNMDIPLGKKIAFVGSSGGGKSTIAQLLIRFYEPSQGQITVNGEPLAKMIREDWMKRIDIVFQDAYLFPNTIHYNLTLGRNIQKDQLEDICRSMGIHEFIASLQDGYDTNVGERGIQLSGGQRQRIALARALLSDSEILILDEATSALDLETERLVQQQLDILRKNKTTIIIAHRLTTVMNADIIYVLDGGCVEEQGTHERLLERGKVYAQLALAELR